MPTLLVIHEIDDQATWLASPKRKEVFGPLGITVRPFVDPTNPNRVGLIVDTPDMATFDAAMQTEAAAAAMAHDGVHPETLVMFVEP